MVLILVVWSCVPRAWVERWWRGPLRALPSAARAQRWLPVLPPPADVVPAPELPERPHRNRPAPSALAQTLGLTPNWWAATQAGMVQARLDALFRPAEVESTRIIATLRQGLLDCHELAALPDSSRAAILGRADQRLRERWRAFKPLAAQLGYARRSREFASIERRLFGELSGAE